MDDTLDLELRLGPRDASPWSNGAAAEGPRVDLLLSTDARKDAWYREAVSDHGETVQPTSAANVAVGNRDDPNTH